MAKITLEGIDALTSNGSVVTIASAVQNAAAPAANTVTTEALKDEGNTTSAIKRSLHKAWILGG